MATMSGLKAPISSSSAYRFGVIDIHLTMTAAASVGPYLLLEERKALVYFCLVELKPKKRYLLSMCEENGIYVLE